MPLRRHGLVWAWMLARVVWRILHCALAGEWSERGSTTTTIGVLRARMEMLLLMVLMVLGRVCRGSWTHHHHAHTARRTRVCVGWQHPSSSSSAAATTAAILWDKGMN